MYAYARKAFSFRFLQCVPSQRLVQGHCSMSPSTSTSIANAVLANVETDCNVTGASLWKDRPCVVAVFRRPGCGACLTACGVATLARPTRQGRFPTPRRLTQSNQ
jgi:hypothetical protein